MRFRADHEVSRARALARWAEFLPRAGAHYAEHRNTDSGSCDSVSRLSPFVRHRLITEAELAFTARRRHGAAAEKFIQEVCWRTYWKGWLEHRPTVWAAARDAATVQRAGCDTALLAGAEAGATGIACFDHWARQLRTCGYLHNHARMWTASIWIFTLKLPWALGADWFMRHLLDADAASNTLSWRWVAGLHTQGKHYLARADNIARFTEGRFVPHGQLCEDAPALPWTPPPESRPLIEPAALRPDLPTGWLLHAEDLDGDGRLAAELGRVLAAPPRASAALLSDERDADSEAVGSFRSRLSAGGAHPWLRADAVSDWSAEHGLRQLVLPECPVGPLRDVLQPRLEQWRARGLRVVFLRRSWDAAFWPHARRGFFQLKKRIPGILDRLGASQV